MTLRVLHVINNLDYGGVQRYLLSYLKNIDRTKVVFDFVVQSQEKGAMEDEVVSLGSRVYKLPSLVTARKDFAKQLMELLTTHSEYRAIEVHQNFRSLLPLEVAKRAGVPIRIAHSHNTYEASSMLKGLYRIFFKSKLPSVATHYWGCSPKANEWLYGKGLSSDAEVIPNAIEVARFEFSALNRRAIREQYGINGMCIGHVGTASPAKNHRFLIEIFSKIYAENPRSKLMLVGCAEDAQQGSLMDLAEELKCSDGVVFLGLVSNPEMYLSAMDVFVFPSLYEGLPIVCVEAQANRLRIVATENVIPVESNLCSAISFLSLEQGPEVWAQIISRVCREGRIDDITGIVNGGYEIKQAADKLAARYLAMEKACE